MPVRNSLNIRRQKSWDASKGAFSGKSYFDKRWGSNKSVQQKMKEEPFIEPVNHSMNGTRGSRTTLSFIITYHMDRRNIQGAVRCFDAGEYGEGRAKTARVIRINV